MEATSHLGQPLKLGEEWGKWKKIGAKEENRASGPAPLVETASF